MKKQKLFNFALTTMCVAVLSACGSSGGGSLAVENTPTPSTNANTNTGTNNSAELTAAQKAAQEAAAKQAAAEKEAADAKAAAAKAAADLEAAKEEAVKKALAEKEAADKAAAEAKAKEEADKKAAAAANDATNPFGAKDQLTAEPDTTRNVSFVGFKQTVKNNSNLATNTSKGRDSTSDVPTPMAVQNPHPSLDTIVVAEPNPDAAAARVYLEDFDTRFLNGEPGTGINVNASADRGNRILSNIYKGTSNTSGMPDNFNPEIEKQRKVLNDAIAAATKTQNAIQQKKNQIDNDLNTVNSNLTTVIGQNPGSSAPAADIGAWKVQLDTLYKKQSELIGKQAEIKKDLDTATSALKKAELDAKVFTDENPVPVSTNVSTDRLKIEDGKDYIDTKTSTMGKEKGAVWVFGTENIATKHQNFTERSDKANPNYQVQSGYVYNGKDVNGNVVVKGYKITDLVYQNAEKPGEMLHSRKLDGTVAEIYGYRSKARTADAKGFESPVDLQDWSYNPSHKGTPYLGTVAENNLPLVNDYYGAKLQSVQYGRVTTTLNNKAATADYLKEGRLLDGTTPTFVASFGEYGTDGTENHYFYRGINNVGAKELTKLKEDPKNGIITYEGHAVAYGLNNNYRGDVAIPTAIGAKAGFVSGNHANLAVNLGDGSVTGNIYNKWYDSVNSPTRLRDVPLVTLKGVIADNGNIAGTAIRQDNQSTGVFGATLFDNGKEVGGSFASDKHSKDEQWGGVFGGIRTPATPEAIKDAGMAVATDKKN